MMQKDSLEIIILKFCKIHGEYKAGKLTHKGIWKSCTLTKVSQVLLDVQYL